MAESGKYQLSRQEGRRSISWLKLTSFALEPGQLAQNQHEPPESLQKSTDKANERTNTLMSYPLV